MRSMRLVVVGVMAREGGARLVRQVDRSTFGV